MTVVTHDSHDTFLKILNQIFVDFERMQPRIKKKYVCGRTSWIWIYVVELYKHCGLGVNELFLITWFTKSQDGTMGLWGVALELSKSLADGIQLCTSVLIDVILVFQNGIHFFP